MKRSSASIWNPAFINMFVTNILIHLGIYTMNTLSATYADYLGAAMTLVGFVSGAFALTALVFKILSAPAIDAFNRKYILMGSIGILLLSFGCYTVSETIPMLVFSRLLTGTGLAFSTTCCLTIASDALSNSKMGTGIGYFTLGSALCQAIAPTMGLKLVDHLGYRGAFAVLSCLIAAALICVSQLQTERRSAAIFHISVRSVFAREAAVPAALLFLLNISLSVINAFLVIFAGTRGVNSDIGYFFTVYAVTMLGTRPLIGTLSDRYGTTRVVVPSLLCFAASFVIIGVSINLPMFLFAGFISAFGYGGCQPAIFAVCMKSVPRERRGAASCTGYLGQDMGNLLGPVISGAVAQSFGYGPMWILMTIPTAAAITVGLVFRKQIDNAGQEYA